MRSTHYYDEHAARLSAFYNGIESNAVHRSWIEKHLPQKPGFACDIGAGSGRDANWLASQGWDVVAVEPSANMRELASVPPPTLTSCVVSAYAPLTNLTT